MPIGPISRMKNKDKTTKGKVTTDTIKATLQT
jgi:hypothetical protein